MQGAEVVKNFIVNMPVAGRGLALGLLAGIVFVLDWMQALFIPYDQCYSGIYFIAIFRLTLEYMGSIARYPDHRCREGGLTMAASSGTT